MQQGLKHQSRYPLVVLPPAQHFQEVPSALSRILPHIQHAAFTFFTVFPILTIPLTLQFRMGNRDA
jgi:hypothetical protein